MIYFCTQTKHWPSLKKFQIIQLLEFVWRPVITSESQYKASFTKLVDKAGKLKGVCLVTGRGAAPLTVPHIQKPEVPHDWTGHKYNAWFFISWFTQSCFSQNLIAVVHETKVYTIIFTHSHHRKKKIKKRKYHRNFWQCFGKISVTFFE